jgi:hypothetical protein
MNTAKEHIARRVARFAEHPFFTQMKPSADLKEMMAFAPAATFWVMSFQDILRFNHERTTDPALKRAIATHLAEDSGHEDWFLSDLADVFGPVSLSAKGTFSPEHREVRQVAFALASELYFVSDDRLRLVYLEVLEAAAGLTFNRISAALVAGGHKGKLRYFGGEHLNAEASHEMHDEAHGHAFDDMVLPDGLREEAGRMIDRMFDQFDRLNDALRLKQKG